MITQTVCESFLLELATGVHNFETHTFKIALYTSSATLNAATTIYSSDDEISGDGYTGGGTELTAVAPVLSNGKAICDFADASWSGATFTARGALIYNSTAGDKAVMVLDFGSDKTVSAQTFTVRFPTADASGAILRIVREGT